MPTENRSSNTEMLCVPRQLLERVTGIKNKSYDIEDAMLAGSQLRTLLAQPAPPPHAEPIAWMVGTTFWWTKEVAERDSAATGLPIVGLGPMTGIAPAEQHQGEPVATLLIDEYFDNREVGEVDVQLDTKACETLAEKYPGQSIPLYIHADPVEVERLREDLAKYIARANDFASKMQGAQGEAGALRDQLRVQDALLVEAYQHDIGTTLKRKIRAQHDAISASAEPSAPAGRDELTRMVDAAMREMSNIHPPLGRGDCARLIRAALDRTPS